MRQHFKVIYLFMAIGLAACGDSKKNANTEEVSDSIETHSDSSLIQEEARESDAKASAKKYSNERFKDVIVTQVGADKFVVEGKAQVFEANISWVVEDGHNEIKKGYEATDAGAPEWGKFDFTIDVDKQRKNSTLTLILFEISAKDGSRQHELPIVLY